MKNKKWYPWFFVVLLGVAFVAWLIFDSQHQAGILVSAVGGIIAFTAFLYQQHLSDTKFFNELFVRFNAAFGELNGKLDAILHEPEQSGVMTDDQRDAAFDYFNLCAEEYYYYRAGYIPREVWCVWVTGMKAIFGNKRIMDLWRSDSGPAAYYGFDPTRFLGI